MTWRNPYPRRIVTSPANPTHGEAAVFRAGYFWRNVSPVPPQPALRIRAGAREACRRLRQERDVARAELAQLGRELDRLRLVPDHLTHEERMRVLAQAVSEEEA